MNYHMAIDMWSLGCILAELYTGYPIFPGENEQEQLSCIMEVLGSPDKDFINRSSRKKLFFGSSVAWFLSYLKLAQSPTVRHGQLLTPRVDVENRAQKASLKF